MSQVRVRAIADVHAGTYSIKEAGLVFIRQDMSIVQVPDDNTTATLATQTLADGHTYTCIGIAMTSVSTDSAAFGGRMFTYLAFGAHHLAMPNPSTFIGDTLYWVKEGTSAKLTATATSNHKVGQLLEIIDAKTIRVLFTGDV